MSRRHRAQKREILPDPLYKSLKVTKFMNNLMLAGKKPVAERVVYGALEQLAAKLKLNALEIFETALDNVKPSIEVKSRRVGGATYQVPSEVHPDRQMALAMRWIINAARGKRGKNMETCLYEELMDAYNNRGSAVKKREDTHKMADANKAFSHFKW